MHLRMHIHGRNTFSASNVYTNLEPKSTVQEIEVQEIGSNPYIHLLNLMEVWKHHQLYLGLSGTQVDIYQRSPTYVATFQVNFVSELLAHLVESSITPITKPVEHTSAEHNSYMKRTFYSSIPYTV